MTLSDKDIQELQGIVKTSVTERENTIINIVGTDKYYKIIHNVDKTTQSIGVVPVDNEAGDNPNYQETTIVVAGTQVPFEHLKHWDDQAYFWKKDFDITASTANAFVASGWFGTVQGGLTPQEIPI